VAQSLHGSNSGGIMEERQTSPIARCVREFGGAFGPEEIAIISATYEAVLAQLSLSDRGGVAALTVAKRIIELASDGERDPNRLRAATLASVSK
jgi:hypothetical protein